MKVYCTGGGGARLPSTTSIMERLPISKSGLGKVWPFSWKRAALPARGMMICSMLPGPFQRAFHARVIHFIEPGDLAQHTAAAAAGLHAVRGVLDDHRLMRLDAQALAGGEVNLRVRLGLLHVLIAEHA